jgi:hypothetical protein
LGALIGAVRVRWWRVVGGLRGMTPERRRGVLWSGLSVAVLVFVFRVLDDGFLRGGLDFDEAHFTWGGWCIRKGLVPYREFLEFKPIMIFLVHALSLALYGFKDLQFRWFFLWFPMASLVALHLAMVSRRIDRLSALALSLAIAHLWVNGRYHDVALSDTESVGLTFYFFGVACLIARTPFGDWLKALGAAFLLFCFQSKEPYLPIVVMTWVACFLMDVDRRSPNLRADALRYFKVTGIGAGAALLALCVYMIPTGAMKYYLALLRSYATIYRDPKLSYCVLLGRFHPTTPLNDLWKQFQSARGQFFNFEILGYLMPFVAAFLVFVGKRSLLLLTTCLLAFGFGLYAVTASNCQWRHYYTMTMSGLFFALVVGLDSMRPHMAGTTMRRFVGMALLGTVLAPLAPRLWLEKDVFGTRPLPNAYREPVPGILATVKQYTTPKDRIFTIGMPALYVQANRLSAVRESAITDEALGFYPGNTDEERLSVLRGELERNMPKLVVMDPADAGPRKAKHTRILMMPFLTSHGYTKLTQYIWLRPY